MVVMSLGVSDALLRFRDVITDDARKVNGVVHDWIVLMLGLLSFFPSVADLCLELSWRDWSSFLSRCLA